MDRHLTDPVPERYPPRLPAETRRPVLIEDGWVIEFRSDGETVLRIARLDDPLLTQGTNREVVQ